MGSVLVVMDSVFLVVPFKYLLGCVLGCNGLRISAGASDCLLLAVTNSMTASGIAGCPLGAAHLLSSGCLLWEM